MYIDGTVYFDIIVGDYSNFLGYPDLEYFEMVETAGIALPYFKVGFKTPDVNIKNKIIENNPITIRLGESPSDAQIFDISLVGKDAKSDSTNQYYSIKFEGFLTDKRFLIDRKIACYNGTSLQVLKQLSSEYFFSPLETSITSVLDTHGKWRQCNETAQVFMSEVWLHMNITPSAPLIAINKDNTVTLKDLEALKKEEPKWVFTPTPAGAMNEIRYYNSFKTKSYKFMSNLYSGYGRVISIPTTETGNYDVIISDNDPELSATQTTEEQYNSGRTVFEGFYNNGNVHDKWHQSYFNNSSKLVKMSSIIGDLQLMGYYKNIKLLDLVRISTADMSDPSIAGKYIIDTLVTKFGYNNPITTTVYVTRDNANNIEDNVADKQPKLHLTNKQQADMLTSVRNLRQLVSLGRQYADGNLLTSITSYATALKYGVFSSFMVGGVALNLNSQLEAVNSLKYIGNGIINNIIDLYIPAPFNNILQNFAINNLGLLSYFAQLISQFELITEFSGLLTDIVSLMAKCTGTLNEIAGGNKNTGYKYEETAVTIGDASASYFKDSTDGITDVKIEAPMDNTTQTTITNIVDEFGNNTNGIDVPLVAPDLTESELLQTPEDLKDLLADKTVDDLTDRGYLDGVDNFKDILLGNIPLDFNTINMINNNVGNTMNIRHYGSFKGPVELTDYFIRKSYKETYKTVGVTKIINARGGKRIFIALPSSETGLKFYINSVQKTMNTMDINLHYLDTYKNEIPYTVYYTEDLYNSNSVTAEVRR